MNLKFGRKYANIFTGTELAIIPVAFTARRRAVGNIFGDIGSCKRELSRAVREYH